MKFKEFGNKELPTIILIHGGGLSWWSLKGSVKLLERDYHVVTPIIDGHGEDGENTFLSIEESANHLMTYIETACYGKVFAIGGLSIGAQIVVELLSRKEDIADFAMIESALVIPIKGITTWTVPTYQFLYGLIRHKGFSRLQAKALYVPDHLFQDYYADSLKITKQSLINITLSNGNYSVKSALSKTKSKVMIVVGSKEVGLMQKSAQILHEAIPESEMRTLKGMNHGELSLVYPQEYIKLLKQLFAHASIKDCVVNWVVR